MRAPSQCSPLTDRAGGYIATYRARGTDCHLAGGRRIDLFPDDAPLAMNCSSVRSQWSANGCELERESTCPAWYWGIAYDDSFTIHELESSQQLTLSGDVVSGALHMDVADSTGTPVCSADYSFEAVREKEPPGAE
jgi:hypothetical protein